MAFTHGEGKKSDNIVLSSAGETEGDQSQDPEYLADEALKRIVYTYEEMGVIRGGAGDEHVTTLLPTFADLISTEQSRLNTDKTIDSEARKSALTAFVKSHYLLTGDSVLDFRRILNWREDDPWGLVRVNERTLENYSDALAEKPALMDPEYGDLVRLVCNPIDKRKGFNQHANPDKSSPYLTRMDRGEQRSKWPELIVELRRLGVVKYPDHFRVYDVIPQALSALALSSQRDTTVNTIVENRHIELQPSNPNNEDNSLFSGYVWHDKSFLPAIPIGFCGYNYSKGGSPNVGVRVVDRY